MAGAPQPLAHNNHDLSLPRKYISYSEDGNSKLHFSCYIGDYKSALMLLLAPGVATEVRNVWKETPLHHCTSQGHLQIMMLLLDAGADVNAQDKDSYTPLHHAIIHGNREATELLLCYGANAYISSFDTGEENYRSPFELAGHVHVCHDAILKAQGK